MKLRVVGYNSRSIFIQTITGNNQTWEQTVLTREQFIKLMNKEFHSYWVEYLTSKTLDSLEFFYNYGYENGETYIFEN